MPGASTTIATTITSASSKPSGRRRGATTSATARSRCIPGERSTFAGLHEFVRGAATADGRSGVLEAMDGERFRRLIEPVHDRALGFARCLCRSSADGDDLFQEAMVRALAKLGALREDGAFRP